MRAIDLTVVHSSPLFIHVLRSCVSEESTIRIADTYFSWSEFVPLRDFAAPWLLLDAFLDDHVPALVKVRALAKMGTRSLIVGPLTPKQVALLKAEGAAAVFVEDLTMPELTNAVSETMASADDEPRRVEGSRVGPCNLSDRELQVLELYSRRRALQAAALGPALGLSPETIRVHLRNARHKLRQAGWPSTSRAELGRALTELGCSITDEQWQRIGRW